MYTLDAIPLLALLIAAIIVMLICSECGYRLGWLRLRSEHKEPDAPVGGMVGAGLGLLAFLLAMAFSLAANRFDDRRLAVLDEANAIGTCYLRAGILPDAQRAEVRGLLREYTELRIAAAQSENVTDAIKQSEALQVRLWRVAESAGRADPKSVQTGLFVESLNTVIDLHGTRIHAALLSRLPATVWLVLLAVAALSFGMMGYHGGLAGTARSPAIVVVAIAFAGVLWLVMDLERPHGGVLRVSQQSMVDLRNSMNDYGM